MIVPIAGTGPVDEHGRVLHAGDLTAQLALAVANIAAEVRRAGLAMADVVDLRVSTTDPLALDAAQDVLAELLAEVGAAPSLTCVAVTDLGDPDVAVVLDGHAVRRTEHRDNRSHPDQREERAER